MSFKFLGSTRQIHMIFEWNLNVHLWHVFFFRFEKCSSLLGGHSAFTVCCLHAQVWERQSGAAQPDPLPGDPPTLQHSGTGARVAQLPEVWEHGQVSSRLSGITLPYVGFAYVCVWLTFARDITTAGMAGCLGLILPLSDWLKWIVRLKCVFF